MTIFHWVIIPRLFNNELPASVLWSPFLYTKNDISGYLLKCVLQLSPGSRAQTFQIITKLKFQQMSYRVFYCPKKGSLALADLLHAMLLQVPWPLHSLLMLAWLTKFTCIATILWCDIAWSPFTYTIPFALEQVLAGMLRDGVGWGGVGLIISHCACTLIWCFDAMLFEVRPPDVCFILPTNVKRQSA